MRPVFYGFSFAHHGPHAAFHGLARALSDCRVIDVTPPRWFERLPPRLANSARYRWYKYSEWRLRPAFAARPRRAIHYFFPENTMFRADRWKGPHRLIATVHQPPERIRHLITNPNPYSRLIEGLNACDDLVVQTACDVAPFTALFPRARLHYIPLGVDATFFRPAPGVRPEDPPRILTVGNWLRDYRLWADVAADLGARRPDLRFDVVANPDTQAAARAALGDRRVAVTWHAGISDAALRDLYASATLLFLPLTAAMANDALLEAMAMALPVAVSDLAATRDYLGDAGDYFANTPDAARGTIEGLLADPAARCARGERGRRRAETIFDWPRVADSYRALYAETVQAAAPAGKG